MSFLLNIIPAPYRWLAIGLMILAVWGHGYVKGRVAGENKVEAITARLQSERDQQALKTAQKVITQKQITQEASDAHAKNIAAIRAYYARKLRSTPTPGLPALPDAPAKPDDTPADCGSDPQYIELAGRAAETTQQLIDLQNWIREQAKK